ncbi:M48 family metallopeptidase [Candidatus Omnitrophota bacterium]
MFRIKPLILFSVFIFLFGCAVVPITGRRQLSLISNSQLVALSNTNYRQILKESKFSQDSLNIQLVKDVGSDIAQAAEEFLKENGMENEIKSYQWEFSLIEDDEKANAFAMPGGKIAVYTGILEVTKDKDGLATVMAHEVAHAIANHGGERISQMLLVELGGATLSEALSKNPGKTTQIWMLAYGLGTNIGVILPYSRTQELEADRIGLILMAKAGYDPMAAIPFWERMNEKAKSRPLEFLSTHPAPERRIEDIRKAIPEALEYYKK